MIEHIVLASGNKGKIQEFSDLFNHYQVKISAQNAYDVPEADETGLSFIENAILKARNAAKYTNLPAIADDSGLCVPYLDDAPGIYSARYAGAHGDERSNNLTLLKNMGNTDQRNAYFVCTIAFCRHAKDPLPIIATGIWQGEILRELRGDHGFGYDPLFFIPEMSKSAAELTLAEKNQYSHRAKALNTFMPIFIERVA